MAEDRIVSLAEVKEMLTAANDERGELVPSLKAAMDNATKVCPLSKAEAEELIAKVSDILSSLQLSEEGSKTIPVKIADTLPKYAVEVRALFANEKRLTVPPEIISQILDAVAEYIKN